MPQMILLTQILDQAGYDYRDLIIQTLKEQARLGHDESFRALVNALEDGGADIKVEASRALGELGDVRAARHLIRKLADPEQSVCVASAMALGRLRSADAVDPLIDCLHNEDPHFRMCTARALGEIGDKKSLPSLIALLEDEDWPVCCAAAEAMEKLGELFAKLMIEALMGSDPALQKLIRSRDHRVITPLSKTIETRHEVQMRARAVHILGGLGEIKALEPLIRVLADETEEMEVRRSAVKALEGLGDRKAVPYLIESMETAGGLDMTSSIIEALGKLGGKQAVDHLIPLLKDQDWEVRNAAATALGNLQDSKAIAPLIGALGDGRGSVQASAMHALVNMKSDAVEPLIKVLETGNDEVRILSATALGDLRDARAKDILIRSLEDGNAMVRRRSIDGLGKIGSEDAVEYLVEVLEKGNNEKGCCVAAAEALGRIGAEKAFSPLMAALENSNEHVRRASATAVMKLGETKAIAVLADRIKAENDGVAADSYRKAIKHLALFSRTLEKLSPFCKDCLTRFTWHKAFSGVFHPVSYYACRTCKSTAHYFIPVKKVILVLDRKHDTLFNQQKDALYINWFMLDKQKQVELFDFDEVVINDINDPFEIDEFVMRLKNDPEDRRLKNYKKILVKLYRPLPPGKVNLLVSVFG